MAYIKKENKNGRQGDGGGRKTEVLSPEQIDEVEKLAAYLSQDQIADFLGICRKTFLNIRNRQPEVNTRYNKGRASVIGMIAQNLISKARRGDTTSQIFYLKTQAGWKEPSELELGDKTLKAMKVIRDDIKRP